MNPPLRERVAIVTGGGRGIGFGVVEQLAEAGARIVINDLDPEAAREAVDRAAALGSEAVAVIGSVTDSDFPDRCLTAAMGVFGRIDIIVNNAGFVWNAAIHKQSDEQWDAMQDVHLKAPFRLLRAFHPILRTQVAEDQAAGTRRMRKVVNIMSASATGGTPGLAGYSAAKAGLYGLTRTLAKEWGSLDVNVNAVSFGLIETRLTQVSTARQSVVIAGRPMPVGFTPEAAEDVRRRIALGRPGTPREAAGGVMIMCLPQSDYITGQILEVDGGLAN